MIKATRDPEKSAKDRDDIQSILKYTRVDRQQINRRAEKDTTSSILKEVTDSPWGVQAKTLYQVVGSP